jgi:hypothetical protein
MPARPHPLRVMFFIDGQNLHGGCLRHFGHGLCHPHLLAQALLEGRRLAGVRFYTGIHDPRMNLSAYTTMSRRLQAMEEHGV